MHQIDYEFSCMLRDLLERGESRDDRTGTGTYSLFGYQYQIDVSSVFPILSCKRVPWKLVKAELEWFVSGRTDLRFLLERGVHFWTPDAIRAYSKTPNSIAMTNQEFESKVLCDVEFEAEHGFIKNGYGRQWRNFNGSIDQLQNVVTGLRNNPNSRRHIVSAWNPIEVDSMTLPPCHTLFQFNMSNDKRLDLKLYQRSADVFLGVPLNIACYALLMYGVAAAVGATPGVFTHSFGDLHLYKNHVDQANTVFDRVFNNLDPLRSEPKLEIDHDFDPYDLSSLTRFSLIDYNPLSVISAPLSVG